MQVPTGVRAYSYNANGMTLPHFAVETRTANDLMQQFSSRADSGTVTKGTEEVIEEGSKADFTGKLRGVDITLEGMKTKEIIYVKRDRTELQNLRKEFDNTIRKQFLSDLSKDTAYLKEAGFSDTDILKLQKGRVPDGWQVHHKVPIDDSGTNSFDNLILIQNEPYHKIITNFQNSFAKQLVPGEKQVVDWPVPEGNLYPKKH
ncbi:hypothetical protein F9802_14600 [Bacillus aerolatus]|uniref:HNH domain-containing protein n=1 Tax=Bacillus aerolatus TaxID=2653354 RepID=A0A6I1FD68_9BACI|nr:HNH endonuclease [Bacillus aerolatus]KAB7705328.1 hypothetical protein F9802_14600 [Bacillus aerolatus]